MALSSALGGRRRKFERDAKGEIVKDAKGKPVLGKVANGSDQARAAAPRAIQERAARRSAGVRLTPTVKALQEAGITSLRA